MTADKPVQITSAAPSPANAAAAPSPANVAGAPSPANAAAASAASPAPSATPATPDALFAFLDGLGIAHKTVWHEAVFTVEEAKEGRGEVPGAHTKNLFLRDKKGAPYLVVALDHTAVELRSLHRKLGATGRFSFGSAELMAELLGVTPGSVTPFAVINDTGRRVTVVLDAAMMAFELLNFHPLINTGTTSVAREGLLKFLEATGHRPRIEVLNGEGPVED
jgi:Ala-tRNA(Pro) deacylase